jgi:hypothetical protein
MEEHEHLPDGNRLSIIIATILLAYALSQFFKFSGFKWNLVLPGVIFPFDINFTFLTSFLVAVLAALGTDWILSTHPHCEAHKTLQYTILPALTAWLIGIPLSTLRMGLQWWVVFALGGGLLLLVIVAEYIAVDFLDLRHTLAVITLTAVSFSLFLILAIVLRAVQARLYILIPALGIMMVLVSLRFLYLRLDGKWYPIWAISISAVICQIAIGLHYWKLFPLTFGLLLLGLAYAINSFVVSLIDSEGKHITWVEPVLMLLWIWGLSFIVGGNV